MQIAQIDNSSSLSDVLALITVVVCVAETFELKQFRELIPLNQRTYNKVVIASSPADIESRTNNAKVIIFIYSRRLSAEARTSYQPDVSSNRAV